MYEQEFKMSTQLNWTAEAEKVFCDLKQALVSSTALALLDYNKPFIQMVDCKGHYMTSVLVQQHGAKMKPIAYFLSKLDSVASEKLPSNHSAQAAELVALTEACKLMKGKQATIYTDSMHFQQFTLIITR
uniref:Reverse transcriptase/retrotransposon-derived protein RNase H-like domain-containing protein n=1 Tax=Fundulus heteroclitus TaxID=8078 RepID=A0A3Q2PQE5_FUNHE